MRKFYLICLLILIFSVQGFALDIGGVKIPDSLSVSGTDLQLNGAGIRTKVVIKVYAGALYLQNRTSDFNVIMNADEKMAIRLHFIYDGGVDGIKLQEAWNEGFKNAAVNTAGLKKEIDQFNSYFKKKAMKNDIYDITYSPEEGMSVIINNTLMGRIPGKEFKKAVFGIWLSEKTALPVLRKAMLGIK